jgi:POT family proton-dependent oligopeptide transporter
LPLEPREEPFMATATAPAAQSTAEGGFFGHPKGLFILFFTEMWERFSYYGMRSLLVLYMIQYLFDPLHLNGNLPGYAAVKSTLEHVFGPLTVQAFASQIYGLYTAFVYLTPIFGGMLADRVTGQRRAVVLGAIVMAIGEFTLMNPKLFFLGLVLLILGNGLFKPNISTQVGGLYKQGDPRRDGAFTIFYMGINLGAFLAPLVCGTLGQRIAWKWGFCAAGVGMVLGLLLYLWGQKHLAPDLKMQQNQQKTAGAAKVKEHHPITKDEWTRIIALLVLCALNIIFWGVYEQQGNTMQVWAEQSTHWPVIFGFQLPSSWFQAFNPLMIFAFAPVLTMFWGMQSKRGKEPTSVTKMAIGCFLLGLSYIIMIVAAAGATVDRSVLWLIGTTFVLTIGELYLSPIGLSLVTKVAPARMVSMMMGAWFLSSFFGNYMNGFLGTFYERMPKQAYFAMLTGLGLLAGVLMIIVNRPLNRVLAHHDRPQSGDKATEPEVVATA